MPHPLGADPRPLTGEPLALDLLNTRWIDAEGPHDLLDSVDGLAVWLAGASVRSRTGPLTPTADRATLDRLLETRAALDALVLREDPSPARAVAALNEILANGRIRRRLEADGAPGSVVELTRPEWAPAWYAAENWLHLVAERPDRIRPCANEACVLHFYDVSKNGTRRWCSMAGCGNRAKAQRHYARRSTS
ncbi:CGNR zinc finger domain-containing protein [Streptomyces sp. NBC_01218]|uniref:CGNR zinc finger domain-containing protein n=1 Tax=unclassified Streptomyces TaxID=2593676 RepID=UPI0023B90801|nr:MULTISPECIES: CGNR zinc finger domain-containing protein [unclassified Streptomyces]WEH39224.1 CGNR zinc finger domain-containing protein [Streptomyces sp. AM 2-1-1]WSQ50875.1 CGNR zinc finger domain-containing protein [Streptomyces sp. NBC_01218]